MVFAMSKWTRQQAVRVAAQGFGGQREQWGSPHRNCLMKFPEKFYYADCADCAKYFNERFPGCSRDEARIQLHFPAGGVRRRADPECLVPARCVREGCRLGR